MSKNNKVVWTEGMFLRPQHFQQQEQHLHNWINLRCSTLQGDPWGLSELVIDEQLLALGKFSITSCSGIFPDGTPFRIPYDATQPLPLEVSSNIVDKVLYLSLPLQAGIGREVSAPRTSDNLSRYHLTELEKKDIHTETNANTITITTGELCPHLQFEDSNFGAFANIPIARVIERRSNNQVVLDDLFIPSCINVHASKQLNCYISEIQGLLQLRGNSIASRIGSPGASGVADVADFLLLQIINRYDPLFSHWAHFSHLHPEILHRTLAQMAGELSTITETSRRPPSIPNYVHNNLTMSFAPLMDAVRNALNWAPDFRALSIPLEERKFGIRTATINDPHLVRSAIFVIAVNAHIPTEKMRVNFPKQTTIATTDKLRDLVMTHTPGIEMRALEVAPRQIPFHAGFTYFELDKYSELWTEIEASSAIAMHFSGEYPGLEIEFWAIKG